MGRRAAVLGGIARLKQICVHPALLTESRHSLGERSGKVTRLVDLCAQIVDEGQAVVVFTQFASFVPDLAAHLRHALGVEVATLTGSDSRAARSATVSAFSDPDGPPILIASLKAGGTGLTLVRANHVIHLDRWWNPAVEDQASDRVWRIGQHQKVSVHVLVCPGTLEDRIDEALSAQALAGGVRGPLDRVGHHRDVRCRPVRPGRASSASGCWNEPAALGQLLRRPAAAVGRGRGRRPQARARSAIRWPSSSSRPPRWRAPRRSWPADARTPAPGRSSPSRSSAEGFSAQIQGTGATPYEVRLARTTISGSDRVAADCTCPYGCDDGWCKHAAALAYVAAFLLDRDTTARAEWSGSPPTAGSGDGTDPGSVPGSVAGAAVVTATALTLGADDLAALRSPMPRRDARQLLEAAESLVPHPWRWP